MGRPASLAGFELHHAVATNNKQPFVVGPGPRLLILLHTSLVCKAAANKSPRGRSVAPQWWRTSRGTHTKMPSLPTQTIVAHNSSSQTWACPLHKWILCWDKGRRNDIRNKLTRKVQGKFVHLLKNDNNLSSSSSFYYYWRTVEDKNDE